MSNPTLRFQLARLFLVVTLAASAFSGCAFLSTLFGVPLGLPGCVLSGPQFTTLPARTTDFDSFVPLGNLNPPGHVFPTDHHYFFRQDASIVFPVFVPADGTVTTVTEVTNSTQNTLEYRLDFYPCSHVRVHYDHITALAATISGKLGSMANARCSSYSTGGSTFTQCNKSVYITLKAGDQIGNAGGHTSHGFDFGVYDDRQTTSLADPSRFNPGDQYLHAVSAIPYFDAQDQAILKASTWNYARTATRSVAPIGGTISEDLAGTAQGIWFAPGKPTNPEDPHFAFVHDNFDPTIPVISVGTSVPGLTSAAYQIVSVQTSGTLDRDPSAVTPDGRIYSYDINGGVLLLQLTSTTTLEAEFLTGGGAPPYSFSSNAVVFDR